MKFFFIVAFSLLALDRLSKNFFLKNPDFFESDLIQFQLKKNSGLYFFNLDQEILIPFSAFIILFLSIFLFKSWKKKDWLTVGSFFLILMGGLSNLYDRLVFGYVIDWLWIFLVPISVFNLADIMISLGITLIFINLIKPKPEVSSPCTSPPLADGTGP